MNTERPDNNDPGEASGGGDGSAAEAHGVGEASAGGASGEVGTGHAGADQDGGAEGVEGAEARGVGEASASGASDEVERGHAGAGQGAAELDGGAAGAEKSAGAAEGSAGHADADADADRDDSPVSGSGAGAEADDSASVDSPADLSKPTAPKAAAADQPAGLDRPQASADATPVSGSGAGADAAEADDSPSPDSPADLGKLTAPEAAVHSVDTEADTTPSTEPDGDADAGPGQAAPDSEIPRHDGADVPRPARHRSPVAIAAVAAAVLLVGGGGAYLAAGASGGSGGSGDGTNSGASGDRTPPPLALDGYGGGNGIAPGEPNPYGVTYRVDGSLPDGPDSAPVYRTQGQVTEDEVTRLAEALGVDGTPVAQGQVWRVGVKDGSGPSLQVNRQAPGAWTFLRYSPVIDHCDSATVCGAQPETPTGPPVSEAAAEKAAAPVLKAAGQGTAKLDASQTMGAQRIVNADPVVGGLPTYGWATGVTVNGQGEVVGGTGQLKAPVKSDTYPVLSAEKTLGLLNKVPAADHRMGIGGCASPVPLKDRLEAPCGEPSGAKKSTLTVEKAVFGLASHFVGGRQALVPSWLFEVRATGAKDAFTVTYPAVDPKYIASPASATPTTPASPTGPSDRPSAAPKTRDVEVDGYTAEGDELTVSFTGGVCGDYTAKASESADEVKVTVTYTPWPDKVCIMIAKEIQKTVPLDEPLGDRTVVGSDGKEIPLEKAGARLPETSGAR
ncbi:hypothetical protein ACFXKY_05530 [Streptomyces canus]|uniref:hypothetical protein n=1 Tax=Streptomyces canus TaxID=58343 RepID=UPI0036952C08